MYIVHTYIVGVKFEHTADNLPDARKVVNSLVLRDQYTAYITDANGDKVT